VTLPLLQFLRCVLRRAGCGGRTCPSRANAAQGSCRGPIWRLPAPWKRLSANRDWQPRVRGCCFFSLAHRAFPSTSHRIASHLASHRISSTLAGFSYHCTLDLAPHGSNRTAPAASLRRPGTGPQERSTLPDTARPKRHPADALPPRFFSASGVSFSFCFRPPRRLPARTRLSWRHWSSRPWLNGLRPVGVFR
jgi:hypothetical protein